MAPLVANTLREWKLTCPKGDADLVFPNGAGQIENHANIVQRGLAPALIAAPVATLAGLGAGALAGWGTETLANKAGAAPGVAALAGDAANGAVAHVGLTADAPIPGVKAFAEKFQKEYGYKPDHNGIKGYTAMYVVKAVTEKVGKVDPKAFANAMHGVKLSAKEYPGVLMDVSFDKNGDLDRESFMTKVVNGKQEVVATLPPASAQ